jgi:hypothetical protein
VVAFAAIVVAGVLLSSCKPEKPDDRIAWLRELNDVRFEMNMQFLSMDNSQDIADQYPEAVRNCDPAASRSTFDSISVRLTRLTTMPAFNDKETIERHIKKMLGAWSLIQTHQKSLWAETGEISGLPPRERCLRPSFMLANRVAIEKGYRAILSEAL